MLTNFSRWGKTLSASRWRLFGAALAAGAISSAALPSVARADGRDRDGRLKVEVDLGGGGPRFEERRTKVWVPPVYRTVSDQVWVEPVYKPVEDRVWRQPVVEVKFERAWVPDRFETRVITRRERGRTVRITQKVLVEPGHWDRQRREVVVNPGCWETTVRHECVSEGRWDTVERKQLVSVGHWEWRTERVRVEGPRRDVGIGFELRR
jgi:hypothetical protein